MSSAEIMWRVNEQGRMEACGLRPAAEEGKEKCCDTCIHLRECDAVAIGEDWALDMERDSGWGLRDSHGLCGYEWDAIDDRYMHKCKHWEAAV